MTRPHLALLATGLLSCSALVGAHSHATGLLWFAKTPIGIAVCAALVLGMGLSLFFGGTTGDVVEALIT